MRVWRVISTREGVWSDAGAGAPSVWARVRVLGALAVVIGLGLILLVPALIVGSIALLAVGCVLAVRRAVGWAFGRGDGRRNVRVVAREPE